VLAYAGKTGKVGTREKEKQTKKGEERERERERERGRERMGHSRVVGGCYYLFDSGILRAGWIYLDIPAEASARSSMSPFLRLSVSLFGMH